MLKRFGTLVAALASELRAKNAIIDGESVCLDGEGRSLFLELLRHRRADPLFYAFDLLWLDSDDLRGLPLIERKRALRRLVRASGNPSLLYADHVEAHGVKLFEAACQRDCEGVVAKHRLGTYTTAGPPHVLLEGDHVRATQRWGVWLQRLVRHVAIALIQYVIETDNLLVVSGRCGRIHRDDRGVTAQRGSDR